MRTKVIHTIGAALFAALLAPVLHAADVQPYQEYSKRVKGAEQVSSLSDQLFGENVSLYNGATDFTQVDISLPGNDALPVQLVRRLPIEAIAFNMLPDKLYGAGGWDVDVPYITGMFDAEFKWNIDVSSLPQPRCSWKFFPRTIDNARINDIFSGYTIHIPGAGNKSLEGITDDGAPRPPGGQSDMWRTQDFDSFTCTSTTRNGYPGEGFVMHTPDGLKYTFDVGLEKSPGRISTKATSRPRVRIYLLVSKIEDRFGHKVEYQYDLAGHPTVIEASDGRKITMTYSNGQLATATANGRTWTYQYTDGWLEQVTQPDGRSWTYSRVGDLRLSKVDEEWRQSQYCNRSLPLEGDAFDLTITHPSGAAGTFEFDYRRHYRSGVSIRACVVDVPPMGQDPAKYSLAVPNFFDLYSLTRKTISGPGLATPLVWSYAYGYGPHELIGGAPGTCTDETICPSSKTAVVTDPTGVKNETIFGMRYHFNDGKLLGSRTIAPDGTVLHTETLEYLTDAGAEGQPFPDAFSGIWGGDDNRATYLRPLKRKTITQDGTSATFVFKVDSYDSWARPATVTKSSSLGYSRTETTSYYDNLTSWIVGQVKSVSCFSCGGVVMSQTDYDATTALPLKTYSFGKLQQSFTYNADGTMATTKDGRGNTTTLSNWYRGLPRKVTYPATTDQPTPVSESATVDDNGWIKSLTDENGYTINYDHDAVGRLKLIDYPDGDTVAWLSTTQSFMPSAVSYYGLPVGAWYRIVETGKNRKVLFYDAFWRPVVEDTYDNTSDATRAATRSIVVKRYDTGGRLVFQSYPVRSLTSFTDTSLKGTYTEYDSLDRVTAVKQDSEIGVLTTRTEYLGNLQTRVTNARGKQVLTGFQAFDEPAYSAPVWIQAPEGVNTTIVRDAFGKPLSIRRHDATNAVSLTRSYVYDVNQQLCKTVEPETGSVVMHYDAAGNLDWSTSGQNLPSTTTCDTDSVPVADIVTRSYDTRNRLKTLVFPDDRGNTTTTYAPDGAVTSLLVDNGGGTGLVTTDYSYNKLRLLTRERLRVGTYDWALGYTYNTNGHLDSLTYPDGLAVGLAPNALGQPKQMGSYATGVSYYPNGGMAQFSYGNGIVHTMTQNVRQLPERSLDAAGTTKFLDDSYDFDQNANVAAISDGLTGNRGNRTMTYDGLDRLTKVVSPAFGAGTEQAAHYSYDVLDNLTGIVVGGPKPRIHWYCYDTKGRLTNIKSGDCATGSTVTGLGYDVRGNLSNKSGQLFEFDYGNRLRKATTAQEIYEYDGQGRRVRASHATRGAIYSMYDQSGTLRFQRDEREGKAKDYITLNGSLVASVSNVVSPGVPVLTAPSFVSTGSYTVSWTAVAGASRYELQERLGSGSWAQAYSGTATSKAISGKASGVYSYQARACNPSACGAWSAIASVSVTVPPSSVPVLSLAATAPGGDYTVSWSASTGATSYTLDESTNGGSTWTNAYTGAALSKAYIDRAAGNYTYRVKGCNAAGCSAYSATKTVQSIQPPTGAPTITEPSAPANYFGSSYTVGWTAVASATSYTLEERVGTGAWTAYSPNASTSIAITGRTTNTYSYRVKACNGAGCGPVSAEKVINVLLPPTAPTLTVPASSTNGSYTVSWTTPANTASFQIEESANGGAWTAVYTGTATNKAISGKGTGSYRYRGRACNAPGCSPNSAEKTISVLLPPTTPSIYRSVRMKILEPADVYCTVSWTTVANTTKYELQAAGGVIQYSGPENIVGGKASDLAYCSASHVVRACNSSGCSPWSDPPFTQTSETDPGTLAASETNEGGN